MDFSKKYNNSNPILCNRLKKVREKRGLKQEDLIDIIIKNGGKCSSANYISMMENSRSPSKPLADALAKGLGINARYLLDETYPYETKEDEKQAELKEIYDKNISFLYDVNQEAYYICKAISCLALLNGYTVEMDMPNKIQELLTTGNGTFADVLKEYMIFYRNGKKEFSLSPDDVNRLGNNLSDIFMSHIKWNIKKL